MKTLALCIALGLTAGLTLTTLAAYRLSSPLAWGGAAAIVAGLFGLHFL
jgi:hypothetical protein